MKPLHKLINTFHQKNKRFLTISVPYAWLTLFFLLPFLVIIKISLAESCVRLPPFSDFMHVSDEWVLSVFLNLKNYIMIFTDTFYVEALITSVNVACFATLGTLVVGYMMAYGIYRAPKNYQTLLLMLVMLPFWTSFLIRVYAMMNIMSNQGPLNDFLLFIGVIQSPIEFLGNAYAVCLGIIYCYLPFMILPIYSALEKIDQNCIEAAFDLGATPWDAFWRVTIPLSMNGIIAGSILVFIPAIGEFVIPELLGGANTVTIGRTLWWDFFNNRDWPFACALAVIMVILFVIPIMYFQRQKTDIQTEH